jgi:hypothetical protein
VKTLLSTFAIIMLVLFAAELANAQSDPFLGTWKLNVNKSKFTPGPPRKSETRIVVTGPNGMDVSVKRVNANGATQEFEYTTNLDGKSHPITGDGPLGADSIAVQLTAPKTMQVTLTKAGKVVGTATMLVSSDGKALTITSKGTNAGGAQFSDVAVYDKQ